jgi:signal transduction histidine kinase
LGDESSQGLAGQPAAAEQAVAHDAEERGPSTPISAGSNVPEQQGSGFISSANIKSAFFRAATTIRTSMGLDGLAFLDAAPTAFVDYSDQSPVHDAEGPSPEAAGPFCAAIVQSSVDQGGASTPNSTQSRLPEAMLQRFIRKYPNGHIFSADDLGPIGESYAPGKPYPGLRADRGNRRLHEDMTTLFQSFPAAKYIIFLPLWHFQRECWYAATLGWVTDPTTAIEVTDITLLSAFGNSVMAEISRLEAMAASRAKSSFVSSISHELRSPLHGILASSELLRASISDPSLLSTLDMLDSCGRTLLDTFNNLLEHAITVRDGLEGTPKATAPVAKPVMTDLGELVQDVVDAVHFSHLSERAFQSSLTAASDGSYSARPSNDQTSGLNRPLLIMLDIEKRSWELPVDAGVWNRFVMNIFGNALKYTKAGRIEVSLRMLQKADAAGLSNYVCLRVEDTGRGMSADYLKYRLFTPFAQEDSYAPGMSSQGLQKAPI